MVEFHDKESKEQTGLFAYNAVIYKAFLNKSQHSLLAYYSQAYNWTDRKPSFHSQERICRILDMSPGTYQDAKRDLEKLGWISTEKKHVEGHDFASVHVTVHVGRDDPKRAMKAAKTKLGKARLDEEKKSTVYMGRNPAEQRKYEEAINHFNKLHPWLAKQPKFKKLAFPARNQSTRYSVEKQI